LVKDYEFFGGSGAFLRELLPFVKSVKPRISKTQSLFGCLTLICLENKTKDEHVTIDKGLQPLVDSGILKDYEADEFKAWFKTFCPAWVSCLRRSLWQRHIVVGLKVLMPF